MDEAMYLYEMVLFYYVISHNGSLPIDRLHDYVYKLKRDDITHKIMERPVIYNSKYEWYYIPFCELN